MVNIIERVLRHVFFLLVVRPVTHILLGLNVRHPENLPKDGPAIVAANHNSHLDAMVLMSLFPLSMLPKVKPLAAADYFLKGRLMSWFSLKIIGIIPVERNRIPKTINGICGIADFFIQNIIVVNINGFSAGCRRVRKWRAHGEAIC